MCKLPSYLPLTTDFKEFLRARCVRYGGPSGYGRVIQMDPDRVRFWMRDDATAIRFETADLLLLRDGHGRTLEEFWPETFVKVDEVVA